MCNDKLWPPVWADFEADVLTGGSAFWTLEATVRSWWRYQGHRI